MKKLTAKQKRTIYERYCEGERQIALAHEYQVDVQVITKICHNFVAEFIKPSKQLFAPKMSITDLMEYRGNLFSYIRHISTNAMGSKQKQRIYAEIIRIDMFIQHVQRITF